MKSILLASSVCLLLVACGGGSSTSNDDMGGSSTDKRAYVGAGSVWDVVLNNSTFNIQYRTDLASPVTIEVNGTHTTKASNIMELNVTSAMGGGSAGDIAYGLEIPGYAFLLQPAGSGNTIPMVTAGTCPATAKSWNFVTVKSDKDITNANKSFFGRVSFDPSLTTNSFVVNHEYALTAGFPETNVGVARAFDANCSDGIIQFGSINAYVTASGGVISQDTSNDNIHFGLPVSNASLSDMAGIYTGLAYKNIGSNTNNQYIVKLTCNATGNCTGSKIDLDDNDVATAEDINLTASSTLPTGFFTGIVDGDRLVCAVDTNVNNSSKNVMNCIAVDNNKFTNFVLAER